MARDFGNWILGVGFREGLGFRFGVWCLGFGFKGVERRVYDVGCKVKGLGFRVQGSGYKV